MYIYIYIYIFCSAGIFCIKQLCIEHFFFGYSQSLFTWYIYIYIYIYWPIDRTLWSATSPGQNEQESDGNEEILYIPQRFSIAGSSTSDNLVLYPGHSLAWSGGLTPLQRRSQCILQVPPTPADRAFDNLNSNSRGSC